jgi:rhodanese-related sulfurtransferase
MAGTVRSVTVTELARWLRAPDAPCVLDVREPWETEIAALPGSLAIPMGQIPARLDDIPTDRAVVCLCHHGLRSHQVALFLAHNDHEAVYNLTGGIDAWSRQVDPECPVY